MGSSHHDNDAGRMPAMQEPLLESSTHEETNLVRRAPRHGYDFSRKRDYRRKVWATFRDTLKENGISIRDSHAMLMPSLEGDEIEVALNAGFLERHLHIVDMEPAIVATLKRRYPQVHTYGLTASRAFQRMAQKGVRIRCANLDFCGCISLPITAELTKIALMGGLPVRVTDVDTKTFRTDFDSEKFCHGVFEDKALISVSLLRGRESKSSTSDWIDEGLGDSEFLSDWYAKALSEADRAIDAIGISVTHSTAERIRLKATYPFSKLLELGVYDRHRVATLWGILGIQTKGLLRLGIPECWKPLVQLRRTESYLSSSGQTMMWSIWEIDSAESLLRRHNAANLKRQELGIPLTPFPRPVSV